MGREYVETDEEERSVSECVHSPFLHRRCCSVSERRIMRGRGREVGGGFFTREELGENERRKRKNHLNQEARCMGNARKVCFLQVKKSGRKGSFM